MIKKYWVFILFSIITTITNAQQTENRSLTTFSGIKAAEGIDVYLKQGDKESARIETNGTETDNVITEVSGSYLKIHMREGRYRNTKSVKVYVTYVAVNKLSASSAANIYSEGIIKASDMDITCSSAGTIEITIDAGSVDVNASSAGEIDLKGKTKKINVDVSSAAEVDAYDVEAETVTAEASSGASVKVNATKELEGHASSGGSIRYRGNPAKTMTNSSSGGSVKKSN